MSNLTIFIKNDLFLKPVIFVNKKQAKVKKENGKLVSYIECDSKAQIKIMDYQPLSYPFGFIVNYFFFLISILGIFDKRYSSKGRRCLFEAEVDVSSATELVIKYQSFHIDQPFVEITSTGPIQIFENKYYMDYDLKKKIKLLFALKIFTWIAVIAIIIIYAIKEFF